VNPSAHASGAQNHPGPDEGTTISTRSKVKASDKEAIIALLVFGEEVRTRGKQFQVRYPTYEEIGTRFGLSSSTVGRYSKEYDCLKRRKIQAERTQRVMSEQRAGRYGSSFEYLIALVERTFEQWEVALETSTIKLSSPQDFVTMLQALGMLHEMKDAPGDGGKTPTHIAYDVLTEAHYRHQPQDVDNGSMHTATHTKRGDDNT